MIQLNSEQKELSNLLIDFLDTNENGYFGVYGAGGTGKTFTICQTIINYKGKVIFLGATNKVTTILKNGLANAGYLNPIIKTIDSFLKFKIKRDHENKQTITYIFPSEKEIPDLIIIDEISLISYAKFKLLEQLKTECKLILLGDYLQLPPIEEEQKNIVRNKQGFQVSRIFLEIPSQSSFTLTIQNRQKEGTALFDLVSNFRNFAWWKPVIEKGEGTWITNVFLKPVKEKQALKVNADSQVTSCAEPIIEIERSEDENIGIE